ncbi:MAG: hypothetical protein ACLU38_07080 [Dysosmobacter sp.]
MKGTVAAFRGKADSTRQRTAPWGSLLAAVLLAGCITLLASWCQPNALRTVLAGFKAQPLLIVLNALPIGLLLLAFAFLFRNVFYSGALVNFFVCALSLPTESRLRSDEPVFPATSPFCGRWAAPRPVLRHPLSGEGHRRGGADYCAAHRPWGPVPSRPVSFAVLKAKLDKTGRLAVDGLPAG